MPDFAVPDLFSENNKQKNNQCKKTYNSGKDEGVRERMDKFPLESRIYMFIQVIMQGTDLSEDGQQEEQEKNDQVKRSFRDHCSEGLIKRDLFISCKDTATGNFAKPWKCHVGKIAYHNGIKCIFKGGMISHGLEKNHPS